MKLRAVFVLLSLVSLQLVSRAQERKIRTSDGVDLFVNVKGQGLPCLYIHGGPGSGSYWLEKFSGPMLEEKFRMVYLDQRGVSRSGSPTNQDFSLDRMLKDFEEVRQALGIKKWIVLGHSFGAGIQTAYARKYPEAVSGMIMLNGTVNIAESLKSTFAYTRERVTPERYQELLATEGPLMNRMFAAMQLLGKDAYRLFYRDKASSDSMDRVMQEISGWNYDFGGNVNRYPEYFQDFSPVTETIRVPVLVFSGKSDYAIGPEHYRLIRFPEQMLVRADVGHLPFLEAPDALESAIAAYLKKYFSKP
ncbi:MAG TPA: alpha/beta hydrolase [Sphingobacteriaceae bacterium]